MCWAVCLSLAPLHSPFPVFSEGAANSGGDCSKNLKPSHQLKKGQTLGSQAAEQKGGSREVRRPVRGHGSASPMRLLAQWLPGSAWVKELLSCKAMCRQCLSSFIAQVIKVFEFIEKKKRSFVTRGRKNLADMKSPATYPSTIFSKMSN